MLDEMNKHRFSKMEDGKIITEDEFRKADPNEGEDSSTDYENRDGNQLEAQMSSRAVRD